ncbi:MAG: hypothetical protein UT34_C0002G0099 [candidate division WS6 bacterium GW2011_GWF2_39_15]|uniref:Uncharacterized protein n=1 Tax=candidate division WS6 bacterium GW2011_GWF2_39_15 TaxID=1619100 RepID=A0A0G0QVE1_9BACT|nr:MAG: hypothetical protein UT34_C0002G0099 [candidate division WS6 bacterium GW2011_GWF2_39_15]
MSKLLKRALKLSILPASLMIAGKFLSVFILIAIYQLQFSIESGTSGIFSLQIFLEQQENVLQINSYSNLLTLLFIAIPTFYVLLRKTILQKAKDNPRTIVKLTRLNILKWVTSDKTPILQISMWTMFLWIIAGICISSSMSGFTYEYIGIMAGVLAILATWGMIRTFEMETDKIYPKNNQAYY